MNLSISLFSSRFDDDRGFRKPFRRGGFKRRGGFRRD